MKQGRSILLANLPLEAFETCYDRQSARSRKRRAEAAAQPASRLDTTVHALGCAGACWQSERGFNETRIIMARKYYPFIPRVVPDQHPPGTLGWNSRRKQPLLPTNLICRRYYCVLQSGSVLYNTACRSPGAVLSSRILRYGLGFVIAGKGSGKSHDCSRGCCRPVRRRRRRQWERQQERDGRSPC